LPIVVSGALDTVDLARLLNVQLDAASETHEAVAVIFPDVGNADEVVALINRLCEDPAGRWYWTEDGIDPVPNSDSKLIGLRWVLRDNTSVNFVLGFASLETMPSTRQSPFTALFLRVIEEKRTPAHRENGRVQVHLADLDSKFHPQERHDQVWNLTKKFRANHVEPSLTAAARARVTFAVPGLQGQKLCNAVTVEIEKDE